MKILTVVGARPQFIKASVITRLIKESDFFDETMIHTGQHFDENMSDIFFKEMKISKPKYNLEINNLLHAEMVDKMKISIGEIISKENPQSVLVYGDTNSTLAGAVAALKHNIPTIHIESGLRSFNREMPEEINRILTDHLSSLLFCPNVNAKKNLEKEGIKNGVIVSGDIMLDAFLFFKKKLKNKLIKSPYILATIHRQENTDNSSRLIDIFSSLDKINEEIPIVMPIHPRTSKFLKQNQVSPKINLIKPLGYLDLLSTLINCEMVITDSGGLQKEAFFAKKKCITVREQTEWIELVDAGVNLLSSPKNILTNFYKLKDQERVFTQKFYSNGESGKLIISSIKDFFDGR